MFAAIQGSLESNKTEGGSSFKNILKIEPSEKGNVYQVRLLPNVSNPRMTFFHYYHHGWKSVKTGQYVTDNICPATWGDRSIIDETRFKMWRQYPEGSAEREKAKLLNRKEQWMVNVYVINDPINPENNGTVKILRFGKQLKKIIDDHVTGSESADFGPRVFDLSPAGCTFKIKAEYNSENPRERFPTYVSSRFSPSGKIDGMTDDKIKDILANIFELEKFHERKSPEEIQKLLDEHFFNKESAVQTTTKTEANPAEPKMVDDDVPFDFPTEKPPVSVSQKPKGLKSVDDLLADL